MQLSKSTPPAAPSRTVWAGLVAAMLAGTAHAQNTTLSTGKRITLPPLGTNTNVGSLPMNMITTPDHQYAIVSDMGFRQKLTVLRTADGSVASALTLGNPILGTNPDGLYYGLAVKANPSGSYTLYAARGAAVNTDGTQPGIGIYTHQRLRGDHPHRRHHCEARRLLRRPRAGQSWPAVRREQRVLCPAKHGGAGRHGRRRERRFSGRTGHLRHQQRQQPRSTG